MIIEDWLTINMQAVRTFFVICATTLLFVTAVPRISAQESQSRVAAAALCSEKVRNFVDAIDILPEKNPNDARVFGAPIRKYLPARGCNVDDVVSISKTSKFFSEAFDWGPAYTVILRTPRFEVTFGLRKDSGDIEYPSASIRLPK